MSLRSVPIQWVVSALWALSMALGAAWGYNIGARLDRMDARQQRIETILIEKGLQR